MRRRQQIGTGVLLTLLMVSCSDGGVQLPSQAPSPSINTLAPSQPPPGVSTGGPAELVWTSSSWVRMPWPDDVAVASDGRVYVRDIELATITILDADGNIVRSWGSAGTGEGQFDIRDYNDPHAASYGGMAILDDVIYVGDKSRVQMFDLDGRYLGAWGSRGRKPGQFLKIYGMAAGPDGNIYIVDQVLKIVQSYRADGRPVARWPLTMKNVRYPTAMCVTPKNEIVVTDVKGDFLDERPPVRILKFSSNGKLLKSWGEPDNGDGDFDGGEFVSGTRGATCSADERIYISDDVGNRVQTFDTEGKFLFSFEGPSGSRPNTAVAISGDTIITTDAEAGTVSKFRMNQ